MKQWKKILLIAALLFLILILVIFSPQFKKASYELSQPYNASGSIFHGTGEKPLGEKLNAP